MRRPRALACALAGLVVAGGSAGCGPTSRDHLGLRQFASSVVYGDQSKPAPPAVVPGASLQPMFPAFIQPTFAPVPAAPKAPRKKAAPAVPDCPLAGFSIPPAVTVTASVPAPPKAASYTYRQGGYINFGSSTSGPTGDAVETVQHVVDPGDGTFTYDVRNVQPTKAETITSYLVDQRTGVIGTDGLYLTQIVSTSPDGRVDQFAPASPIRLLSLPADGSNPTWVSAGTDSVHNLTMQLQGTITGHGRVDACGTVLDSWEVHATGQILSPTKNLSFDSVYDVGPHFGGLILRDELKLTGTDEGLAVAKTQGASCTGGGGSATVDTVTTLAASAPCPGDALSRDTEAIINSSPAVVKK